MSVVKNVIGWLKEKRNRSVVEKVIYWLFKQVSKRAHAEKTWLLVLWKTWFVGLGWLSKNVIFLEVAEVEYSNSSSCRKSKKCQKHEISLKRLCPKVGNSSSSIIRETSKFVKTRSSAFFNIHRSGGIRKTSIPGISSTWGCSFWWLDQLYAISDSPICNLQLGQPC